jgi:hypothetical protein
LKTIARTDLFFAEYDTTEYAAGSLWLWDLIDLSG